MERIIDREKRNCALGIFVFAILFPTSSVAQITFERTYGGTNEDAGFSVLQIPDGGYIIAGWTQSFGAGNADIYLIRTDSLGDTLWTRTYGGTSREEARSIRQTSDGGYILTGFTGSFGAGLSDVYLVKTDSLGDTLWTKTFGGASSEEGHSVQQTSEGGFIITGKTESFGAGIADVYLIKTDSLGDSLWTRTYGGIDNDWGNSVQQTSDGGYIITGRTQSFGAGLLDLYLIKTDSFGDTLWTKTYGGIWQEEGNSVQQTPDGGFIIAGVTSSFGGLGEVYLLKTDSLGDTLWTKTYGGSNWDWGNSVQQTSDGGYIIAGVTSSFGAGLDDVYLVKTDSIGNTLWTRTYGGAWCEEGRSVQETSDGGYIITGITQSYGPGTFAVYLIKTDGNGLVVGVEEESSKLIVHSLRVKLFQNQPNPFHQWTVIGYSISMPSSITLKIYDINGRLVETLVDEQQERGIYQIQWEGKNQASGVYYYHLQDGDFISTKKMILLR